MPAELPRPVMPGMIGTARGLAHEMSQRVAVRQIDSTPLLSDQRNCFGNAVRPWLSNKVIETAGFGTGAKLQAGASAAIRLHPGCGRA